MTLPTTIRDRTNDGIAIVDFLVALMQNELDGFKPCHRLDAAKLLVKYGCSCAKSAVAERSEAFDFILDNPPDPSRRRSDSGSSRETRFDAALAKVIRESTDDGRSVCRFLINVMDGELKAFKPHHRIAAARELLDRGFGKGARAEAACTPGSPAASKSSHSSHNSPFKIPHSSTEESQVAIATVEPDPEDETNWDEVNRIVDDAIEESDRIMAEQAEKDPENIPYARDLSAYNEAWENSQKWFEEWKNSIDPEEYQAIIKETAARFDRKLELRIERRKQIAEDRERRAKEEAERLAQQAEAESAGADESEEPPEPGPPTRSQHKRKLMFVLGDSIYVDCDHPDCDLHEEDRSRFRGSVQYGKGPTPGHFP